MITPTTEARLQILRLMTEDTKKFGIGLETPLPESMQEALEWMQLHDWIRLIDVSSTARSKGVILRIFKVMPEGEHWLRLHKEKP